MDSQLLKAHGRVGRCEAVIAVVAVVFGPEAPPSLRGPDSRKWSVCLLISAMLFLLFFPAVIIGRFTSAPTRVRRRRR